MPTPTEVILAHLPDVTAAVAVYGIDSAYSHLPEIRKAMGGNAFRIITPIVLATADRLYKDYATRLAGVREENVALRYAITPTPPLPIPKDFQGWSVQCGKDGYIRLHKKERGRVLSLHVGKVWDEEKAGRKIAEREGKRT